MEASPPPPSTTPPPADAPPPEDTPLRPPGAWRVDVVVWLVCVAAYGLTGATTLQGPDSSEWVAIMRHGGVAHPPGYPLYCLLLRLWGLLPLPMGAPAQAALLSAVLMATAVTVLQRALEERNGHVFTARIAVVAFAASLPVWRLAGLAEVTALLCLNTALLLHAAQYIENEEFLTPVHGAWLGALLGMGVAAHHALVFVVPMAAFHVVRAHRGAGWRRWTLATLGGVVAGSVVLLGSWAVWLAWSGDGKGPFWVDVTSPSMWWHHVLRRDYGTLSSSQHAAGWTLASSWELLLDLLRSFHLLIPLGLAAGLQVWRGRACLLSLLLVGPLFLGLLTVAGPEGPQPFGLEFRERFHALPVMLFAVLTHDALASLAFQLPRLRRTVFLRAQLGLLGVAMLVAAGTALPAASWKGETALQEVLCLATRTAPANALVVLSGDAAVQGWRPAEELCGVDGSGRAALVARDMVWPSADPATAGLLKNHCKSMPCAGETLLAALRGIRAAGRPVVFFPAIGVDQYFPGLPVVLDGVLARLEAEVPLPSQQLPLVEQALAAVPRPAPLARRDRLAEGQARAMLVHPMVLVARRASDVGDAATATRASALAREALAGMGAD